MTRCADAEATPGAEVATTVKSVPRSYADAIGITAPKRPVASVTTSCRLTTTVGKSGDMVASNVIVTGALTGALPSMLIASAP